MMTAQPLNKSNNFKHHQGIGMTSMRTRERLLSRLREQNIRDERVLDAIRVTPRHLFVDEALSSRAYEDTALPIGLGQTLSQPYVVARMTEALLNGGTLNNVLEVGTGSGYQSLILSQLVGHVYTVERIGSLLTRARQRFADLNIHNITTHHTDGHWGWGEYAPYDGILVTAAPEKLPEELLTQLKVGARLIIPLGPQGRQELTMITKTAQGFDKVMLDFVSFVPLCQGAN
jgi:protein-L-isoaspartate(D-aspartate) O-methyltransferase